MVNTHARSEALLAGRTVTEHRNTVATSVTGWWEYEPAEARARGFASAPTLILVHGFRGTHHGLEAVVARLPQFRVISPDLPGFGESTPMAGEQTLDAYAGWLRQFVDLVDPAGRAIVLGHSFGSLIVARNVRALGDRRIVLVNPISSPALEGPAKIGTFLAIAYYRMGEMLPAPLGHTLLAHPAMTRVMSEIIAVTRDRALRHWIHRQHLDHFSSFSDRSTLLQAFKASVSDSVAAHAAEFPPGTVMVVGDRDQIAPLDAQRTTAAAMPGATLHILEGVGHLIHYERPITLARILIDEFTTGTEVI